MLRVFLLLTILFTGPASAVDLHGSTAWTSGKAVLDADRAFADLSAKKGARAAFEAFTAEDARHVIAGETVVGKANIVAGIAAWVGDGQLLWTPQEGMVSKSGDLGFTWGLSELQVPGQPVRTGRYITIWRKDKDGRWRFVMDSGALDPLAKPNPPKPNP
jgi:ketosteroid isomerase-like protein